MPDFRDKAVAESEASLRQAGSATKLSDLDRSVCLPAEADGYACLRRSSITDLVAVNLAILVLVALWTAGPRHALGSAGLLVNLAACAYIFAARKLRFMAIRSRLARRPGILLDPGSSDAIPVNLEDAATHRKAKVVVEDMGLCWLDPERRRAVIEGLAYRYVIQGRDVLELSQLAKFGEGGVSLSWRIGDEVLSVVLIVSGQGPVASVVDALASPATARGLYSKMARALAPDPANARGPGALSGPRAPGTLDFDNPYSSLASPAPPPEPAPPK